ncbi:MAG TPA: hypothetical protein VHE35_34960 [Kofleriaceae bacterium]|nr:hypothetical protein [Kofleriaceae bacterium]
MELKRVASIVDIVVAALVAFVIILPPRPVKAKLAAGGDDDARLALAFAQARVQAKPDDGALVADLAQRLGEVGQWDWAVEAAASGATRMGDAPGRWRAMLATAIAHADRLEAKEALDYTNRALEVCTKAGDAVCPPVDEVRLELYQKHLDAGVRSGIDPRTHPEEFREAGLKALRTVHPAGGVGDDSPRP